LAGNPDELRARPPRDEGAALPAPPSLLAEMLRHVRITSSLQYCFMPSGAWETDATPAAYKPSGAVGFHIVAGGTCWLEIDGARTVLGRGDIAAFPFGTPHRLGAGRGGPLFDPGAALPPAPWRGVPVLPFGGGGDAVRILCGYVTCEALDFAPFRQALPRCILVRTAGGGTEDETGGGADAQPAGDWLAGIVAQIVAEVDRPRGGGAPVLERLTELALLETLRRQLAPPGMPLTASDAPPESRPDTPPGSWRAALADPVAGRCLAAIHADPARDWSLATLARAAHTSRSVLHERFSALLGMPVMHYLRAWRLFLAARQLAEGRQAIAQIAHEAGYGTEAAFSRAFSRLYGMPPARWRRRHGGQDEAP